MRVRIPSTPFQLVENQIHRNSKAKECSMRLLDGEMDIVELVYKRAKTLECLLGRKMNVALRLKRREMYFFLYDDKSRNETLRVIRRFVRMPELNFSLGDAVSLSLQIENEKERTEEQ